MLFFALMVSLPSAVGFSQWWAPDASVAVVMVGAIPYLAGLAVGTILLVIVGIKLALLCSTWRERILVALAAPALAFLALASLGPAVAAGKLSGAWTRLILNRSHYEEIVDRVDRALGTSAAGEHAGIRYFVDAGPPVRIAFDPVGLLDNWSGIVFDSTGEVMRARGLDWATGRPVAQDPITDVFGGDLVVCYRLRGDYHYCRFT